VSGCKEEHGKGGIQEGGEGERHGLSQRAWEAPSAGKWWVVGMVMLGCLVREVEKMTIKLASPRIVE
jgi:hypothetical protein